LLRFIWLLMLFLSPALTFANPKILVLGDSLSAGYGINYEQGWVNLLEKKLKIDQPDVTVINASISGDSSHGALARLPQALQIHRHAAVRVGKKPGRYSKIDSAGSEHRHTGADAHSLKLWGEIYPTI